MRDTPLAPQPPTNRPTGHQMNRQGLYVPKEAYFGQAWEEIVQVCFLKNLADAPWGHRLPVTALALSVRGLDYPF